MLRGEVWWVEFDPAVGSEIRKTRPAVIMSNKTRATISINKEIWDLLKLNFNCIFLKQTY